MMRINEKLLAILISLSVSRNADAFCTPSSLYKVCHKDTSIRVSVGLGPEAEGKGEQVKIKEEKKKEEEVLIAEPDHELFRESRLTQFDRACDDWYGRILKQGEPSLLGKVSEEALRRILTLPNLEREVSDNVLKFDPFHGFCCFFLNANHFIYILIYSLLAKYSQGCR